MPSDAKEGYGEILMLTETHSPPTTTKVVSTAGIGQDSLEIGELAMMHDVMYLIDVIKSRFHVCVCFVGFLRSDELLSLLTDKV